METETSVDFVKNAFVQTQERAGPPSFVLYNAIDLNRSRRLSNVSFLDKVSQEELQRSLDEHLKGAHLVAKEALELFSNKKKGTLAFSNTPLEIPAPVPVSLVRHAIRGMSLSLAREFGGLTHNGSSLLLPQQFYSGTTEQNKVAIIFGVDEHGFGQGVARRFAANGFKVTLIGRSPLVEETSRKIFDENNGESLTVIPMETETSVDFVKNAFVQTQERAGPPSFVLYNAIDLNRSRRLSNVSFLDKVSQEELQRSLDEHLKGAHLVAKEALELFSNKKKGTLAFSNTPLEIQRVST
eukprot:TRINITY_DN6907_c0_g1_i3.p1 TRINITY_DN6907_c0_g1~~TRINITY_DN6907_c0_g1_i3.p1  ORF type:complete len:297 (+),score=54.33 TRINITY_DN6907_c0_g1_i3:268-1158(+)